MRKIYRLVPLKIKTRLHKNIKTGPFKNKKYKIQTGFENLRTGYKKYALVPNKKIQQILRNSHLVTMIRRGLWLTAAQQSRAKNNKIIIINIKNNNWAPNPRVAFTQDP